MVLAGSDGSLPSPAFRSPPCTGESLHRLVVELYNSGTMPNVLVAATIAMCSRPDWRRRPAAFRSCPRRALILDDDVCQGASTCLAHQRAMCPVRRRRGTAHELDRPASDRLAAAGLARPAGCNIMRAERRRARSSLSIGSRRSYLLLASSVRRAAMVCVHDLDSYGRLPLGLSQPIRGWLRAGARRIGRCARSPDSRRRTTRTRCGKLGQAGMPDTIRSPAGAWGLVAARGFRAALAVICVSVLLRQPAPTTRSTRQPSISPWRPCASSAGSRSGARADAWNLCFAVVTGRASCARAVRLAGAKPRARRDRALKARSDRRECAVALEPHICPGRAATSRNRRRSGLSPGRTRRIACCLHLA